MNAWEVAIGFTLSSKIEGGYANNPHDLGGETIFGISRNNHPGWPGWILVDNAKLMTDFPNNINADPALKSLTKTFYRYEFWDKIHGDELPWRMAVSVFDMAVNSGAATAVRQMQVILPDVPVDGVVGPRTIKAAWENDKEAAISFLTQRLLFYAEILLKKPDQRIWARNWMKRVIRLSDVVLEDPEEEPTA